MTKEPPNKITIPVIRNLQVQTRFDNDGVPVTRLSFSVGTKPEDIQKLLEWAKSGAVQVEFFCPQLTFGMGTKP